MAELDATANAKADAEWPDGNDGDSGIRTKRASAKDSSSLTGRRRRYSDFARTLTVKDVSATAVNPRMAARRPELPPKRERAALVPIQRLE
jgi:hypothetical protein